jgi:hypothetical protein
MTSDTILLFYNDRVIDTNCNKEIDARSLFDTSVFVLRPDKLFYRGDKLYKIENGQVAYRTEKTKPDWIIPKSSRKYYRRKYVLFGPHVSKTKKTYYMIEASKARWD